jgi:oxalate decarboxylase/phosphoglucose isomerase-like protein (cupin superfamily)
MVSTVQEPLNFDTRGGSPSYNRWLASQDVPVHGGYYVQDVRTLERGWWAHRGCPAAVLALEGHKGLEHIHVLEIPPGESIPPYRIALEEVVYVLEGRGLASVWAEGHPKIHFEWQKHSYFRIPTNYHYELSNARGDQPALTLHVNFLPLAFQTNRNPDFFFKNPLVDLSEMYAEDGKAFYSADARAVQRENRVSWQANFFPDLTLWDRLEAYGRAGRLAYGGGIWFPNSSFSTSLMVLPSRRYRTAHRHAAGTTIVGIQEATGFVVMWPEGGDYVVAPWQEGAIFVPPYHWYHMHLNSGPLENRQLRIRAPRAGANPDADSRRMIPFIELDPWIRTRFEDELAKNGLTSLMPEEAYTNPNFEWDEAWLNED